MEGDGTLFVTDFPRTDPARRPGRSTGRPGRPRSRVTRGTEISRDAASASLSSAERVQPFANVEPARQTERRELLRARADQPIDGNTGAVSHFASSTGSSSRGARRLVYGVVGTAGGRCPRRPTGRYNGAARLGPQGGPPSRPRSCPRAQLAPELIDRHAGGDPIRRRSPRGTITTLCAATLARKTRHSAVERCDESSGSGVQRERERGAHLMANPQASRPRAAELRRRGRGAPRRRLPLPALHDRKPTPRRRPRRRDVRARPAPLAPLRSAARLGANVALPARAEHGARPLPRRAAPATAGGHVRRRRARVDEPVFGEGLSPEIDAAVRSLSAAEREVVVLRVVLELDGETTASVLGIRPSAVSRD